MSGYKSGDSVGSLRGGSGSELNRKGSSLVVDKQREIECYYLCAWSLRSIDVDFCWLSNIQARPPSLVPVCPVWLPRG